jgi:hypothetical protein
MRAGGSIKFLAMKVRARLTRMGRCGPFVAGSLNRVEHKGKSGKVSVSYQLTFKDKGKTTTVYIPKDMVPEVQQWIRQHRELKKLMAEISSLSVGIIRRYVFEKRAAARVRQP